MKRILFTLVAIIGMGASSLTPAHAMYNKIVTVKTSVAGADCPSYAVGASRQKFNLSAQPLDLGFGAAIGDDKAQPATGCDTPHRLDLKYYLFTVPLFGPRSLVSIGNNDAFCNSCTRIQSYSSGVEAPGLYQVVGDFFVDGVQVTSVATPVFLYVPSIAVLAVTGVPTLPTIPTLP